MLYYSHKRINTDHSAVCRLSDAVNSALGDKGIAVKVRGNSHYRNSRTYVTGQVGMLIGLCLAKVSRADGGDVAPRIRQISVIHSTPGRVLLFYPFVFWGQNKAPNRSKVSAFGWFSPICLCKAQSLTASKLNKSDSKSIRFITDSLLLFHPHS